MGDVKTWYPMNYAQSVQFVLFCCGLVIADYIHIRQGYFTGTGAIIFSNPEGYG